VCQNPIKNGEFRMVRVKGSIHENQGTGIQGTGTNIERGKNKGTKITPSALLPV
jgi:hypothetical protein